MEIYSNDFVDSLLFSAPYYSKVLLNDSVERTRSGFSSVQQGAVFKGCGNVLFARVESATAFSMTALSSMFTGVIVAISVPCIFIPASILNVLSRIPGISYFQTVQNFTRESSDLIYRTFRVYLVAVPVIFMFLTTASFNTIVPGALGPENYLFKAIDWMVRPMGKLSIKRVIVPGYSAIVGHTDNISFSILEDYFKALSYKNNLKTIHSNSVNHYRN